MIVFALNAKDEAAVIPRWVESVCRFSDHALLVDTGSKDNTQQVFVEECIKRRVNWTVHNEPWVDFAASQTQLLELAGQWFPGHYVWNLDADETLSAPEGFLVPPLAHDGYRVCRLWARSYESWSIRVFKAGLGWRYVGERHATPVLEGASVGTIKGIDVVNHRDGANGTTSWQEQRERFSRDAELFRDKLRHNPHDTRSAYYLAQSLKDAGRYPEALEAYEARAKMRGFAEERYVALLDIARIKRFLEHPDGEIEQAYRRAIAERPTRNEARVELCQLLRSADRWEDLYELAWDAAEAEKPDDRWLVERTCYSWRPLFELAIATHRLGRVDESKSLHLTIVNMPGVPAPERRLAQQNLESMA